MPHLDTGVGDYATLRGLCNTNATPTRLVAAVGDYATPMPLHIPTPARLHEQVAGTGDYATQMPHLQDWIHKSPMWGTMQHQCHYIPTPTRLDKQVTSVGDYATQMPHLQDSSPVWGTNATPTRLDKQVAGVRDLATPMPHLQDSIHKSLVWGTMQHQ